MTADTVGSDRPLAIVMVGLPARGKTHVARRVARYLSWRGQRTRVFNVGNYRRRMLGARQPHSFFDPTNVEASRRRHEIARQALGDMLSWFADGGQVGVYDATNSTRERRGMLSRELRRRGIDILFIESICRDASVIEQNIIATKLRSPDYAGLDPAWAAHDFRERIGHYARTHESVADSEGACIKLVDVGRQLIVNNIHGYLPSRLVYFLLNLHVVPRTIWLTRHGQSEFNVANRVGGDPALSPLGVAYASNLAGQARKRWADDDAVQVWSSTLRRSIDTAAALGRRVVEWKALDEIDAGACEGLTYDEIRAEFPEEFRARQADKYGYRYPQGESYRDIIARLEPVIIELERQRVPVVVVAHQAVLRALYAYLVDLPPANCPFLAFPLHTVVELEPTTYGCEEQRRQLEPRVPS